jgi:hypothetical protein
VLKSNLHARSQTTDYDFINQIKSLIWWDIFCSYGMHCRGTPEAICGEIANYVGNFSDEEGKYMEFKLVRECKLG